MNLRGKLLVLMRAFLHSAAIAGIILIAASWFGVFFISSVEREKAVEESVKQADSLRRGVDLLIATPGRLSDHVRQGTCFLDDVAITALDEADQMADMGFLPQVRDILDLIEWANGPATSKWGAVRAAAGHPLIPRRRHPSRPRR